MPCWTGCVKRLFVLLMWFWLYKIKMITKIQLHTWSGRVSNLCIYCVKRNPLNSEYNYLHKHKNQCEWSPEQTWTCCQYTACCKLFSHPPPPPIFSFVCMVCFFLFLFFCLFEDSFYLQVAVEKKWKEMKSIIQMNKSNYKESCIWAVFII